MVVVVVDGEFCKRTRNSRGKGNTSIVAGGGGGGGNRGNIAAGLFEFDYFTYYLLHIMMMIKETFFVHHQNDHCTWLYSVYYVL